MNKYEKLFKEFIEQIDFKLIKENNEFCLLDLQGANLGDIEEDSFTSASCIADRTEIYIKDYFIDDIAELLQERDVEIPIYDTWEDFVEKAKPILYKDYAWEFDVLDMLFYHTEEVDLNNCI